MSVTISIIAMGLVGYAMGMAIGVYIGFTWRSDD